MMVANAFAQMPQSKVDISIGGRGDDETLEPGFVAWRVKQGVADTLEIEGVTYKLSVPSDANYVLRTGWNKTFIQNAENKEKNGRLTGDGISLDPSTTCGEITLTISGLPQGTHTLQTYHCRWENPANFNGWPLFATLNGELVHNRVATCFWEPVAANATLLTTTFNVTHENDTVSLSFYTLNEELPDDTSKAGNNKAPIINGFELNTISVTSIAKAPQPNNGDIHVDADTGCYTLSWSSANESVSQHRLYFGTDSIDVATSSEPFATKSQSDTTQWVDGLYSMNTYYWRVDEVEASGNVNRGAVWSFRPRQLAFPGAEGYGRYAQGGRGGIVYHVTKLTNECIDRDKKIFEEGSLLYGLVTLSGPRTIVFDVSGLIELDYDSYFVNPFATIAAQTAPGKGVCLRRSNININSENICRFLRAKRGYGGSENTGNALGMTGANHSIVDHTTCAWGTDETVSGRGAKNISFQYSIIAEALGIADHKNYSPGTNHGYAATIDGKIGSWHHNLLVNCNGRNWSMGGGMDGNNKAIGQMDIFNNVCYNWYGRTTDGGCHEVNFVNNYYKMGPDTKRTILFSQDYENIGSIDSKWQAYVNGNIRENKNGTLSQDKLNDTYRYTLSNGAVDPNTRTDEYGYKTFVSEPFFPSYAEIHSAKDALKVVTSVAGATMPRCDNQHLRVVNETLTGTYTYKGSKSGIRGEIDRVSDLTAEENEGWEVWPEEHRPADFDTDQDGVPNWYEELVGSNPEVSDNNEDPDHDGWTLLEDYLEFMAHPYLIVAPSVDETFDVAPWFKGFTNSPVYSFVSESPLFEAEIQGSLLTVHAKASGIGIVKMKVIDAEGSTFEQRLSVAVTGQSAALPVFFDERGLDIVNREFFTIDGKRIDRLQPHDVYLMKLTDADGHQFVFKVLAN